MRAFAAVLVGLLLAVGAAYLLATFAVSEPSAIDKPLQVTQVPAKP
ncbi:hypothetical protein [Yinghuangia soli]|uniref:Uncharacterized protein n=1 Tax=Yinghuangia soli TaxID=2908204 RepID=A0AA41U295_9ACTN|nr:hypothetical protein [Yinghuangia soli]MCF2530445.1 hypothetical protein [Yinghuangia soli]